YIFIDPVKLVCKQHLIRHEVKQLPSSPGKSKTKKPTEQLIQVCVESLEFFSIEIDLSPFLFNTSALVYTPSLLLDHPYACELGCFLNDYRDEFSLEKLNAEFNKSSLIATTFPSQPPSASASTRNKKGDTSS
ncbi:hypothetical protein HMI54_012244, partial [Coelomomyces lativittatus]